MSTERHGRRREGRRRLRRKVRCEGDARLPVGDPRQGNVVLGSLVGAAGRRARQGSDRRCRGQGRAALAAGGVAPGPVMPATVIDHVTPAMRIYSRGDASGRWCRSCASAASRRRSASPTIPSTACRRRYSAATSRRALGVAKRIESGICHINAPTVHDEAQMPFGGTKASGYGRFGGKAAIDEFTELRWITIQTGPHSLSVLTKSRLPPRRSIVGVPVSVTNAVDVADRRRDMRPVRSANRWFGWPYAP